MTTMRRDPLVDDYLRRLEAAAADLPRDRRAELVGEIEEHVGAALAEGGDDETAVRNVLERLGSPEEIAAAAAPPAAAQPQRGTLETVALVVLCASFVVPVVGYLVGAGLVLASKAWAGRDKAIGLVIPPCVVLFGAFVVLAGAAGVADGDSFDSGLGPLEIAVLLADVLSGFIAAAYLASRLGRPTAG
ncbi:MAG TPA: hypothetical protein VD836_00545 [Solirubrobacteraceae bacterium]|nr:hypothetical protein [Solirubrobacteraceae bacterium]